MLDFLKRLRKPKDDFSWFHPPRTVSDPDAWDKYWYDQLSHNSAGFVHIFCNAGEITDTMRASGLKTILCVGNGISHEPRALARVGFDVTVLDLSPFAMRVAEGCDPPEEFLAELTGGRPRVEQGGLNFVTGDLLNTALCPGPYDFILERKTVQLFPEHERPQAMKAVADRLAPRGIFFNHTHDGGWRPDQPRWNAGEIWFKAQGWPLWDGVAPLTTRTAWLYSTSG